MIWLLLGLLCQDNPTLSFDPTQLDTPAESYRLLFRGRIIGCIDHRSEQRANQRLFQVEETRGQYIRINRMTTLDAATLAPKSYQANGRRNKENYQTKLAWEAGEVEGMAGAFDVDAKEIKQIQTPSTLTTDLLIWRLRAARYEPGKTYDLTAYDPDRDRIRTFTVTVGDIRDVLVPLGTFPARELRINEGEQRYATVYLTEQAPRKILRVILAERGMVLERLAKSYETVLREIADQ